VAGRKNLTKFNTKGAQTQGNGIQNHLDLNVGIGAQFYGEMKLHDELINKHGEIVVHETSVACPKCRTGATGDAVLGHLMCSNCSGDGYLFRNPRYIQGIITGISSHNDLVTSGFVQPGDCVMSLSPYLRPPVSDFDKITFTWPQPMLDGEIIVRGECHKNEQERLGNIVLQNSEDRLCYEAKSLIHCEDENQVEYFQDADFVFDKKVVRWVGNQPKIRTRYVIKYEAIFEWFVFNAPFERRDNGKNIGQRVVLRKRHIAQLVDDPKEDTAAEKANMEKSFFGGSITA
jgi:hypothetical protein